MKSSRLFTVLSYISIFLIPALSVLLIISINSRALINGTLSLIIFIVLLILSLFLMVYKIVLYKIGSMIFEKYIVRVIASVLIFLEVAFIMLLYGPYSGFRNWLVTTAMSTMSHQYLCQWFYSDEDIEEIQSHNFVDEVDESTNTDLIDTESGGKVSALKDDGMTEGVVAETDDYTLIRLKVNGQQAYLACVYDPSKVVVAYTDRLGVAGRYVTKMAEQKGALLGINGAGFYDPGANSAGATPGGLTIAGGKVVTDNSFHGYTGGGLIGFDNNNVLHLIKDISANEALDMGIRDAVSWGPFLVVNGKASYVSGNGGWGLAARTAIGQKADGTVLLLVVDSNSSRSKGASMADLAEIMVNYGAVNAANLDGGTSSVMVMPSSDALAVNPSAKTDGYSSAYRIINDPVDSTLSHKTRPIADAWVVLP